MAAIASRRRSRGGRYLLHLLPPPPRFTTANKPSQFWGGKKDEGAEEDGTVPEEWLQSDIKQGISNSDVEHRRKRFGWNEITTEKENLFIKFLMFFTGPILYGKSSTASRVHPMLPSRVLRWQWLVQAHCYCFFKLLRSLGATVAKSLACIPSLQDLELTLGSYGTCCPARCRPS
jgi:hypothetical protein